MVILIFIPSSCRLSEVCGGFCVPADLVLEGARAAGAPVGDAPILVPVSPQPAPARPTTRDSAVTKVVRDLAMDIGLSHGECQ
jgi:hypothetical protein